MSKNRAAFLCFTWIWTGLILPGLLLAPPADASPVDEYTKVVAPAVCETLEDFPTFNGLRGVAQGVMEDTGWDAEDAAQVVVTSIYVYCPDMFPLLNRFIRTYNPPVRSGTVKS